MLDRDAHLKAVTGSLALEGLKASPQTDRLLEQWAAGEKTNADLETEVQRIVAEKSKAKAS